MRTVFGGQDGRDEAFIIKARRRRSVDLEYLDPSLSGHKGLGGCEDGFKLIGSTGRNVHMRR